MAGSQLRLDVGGELDGYRGPAVCRIVGITYRQLDYWTRTDLVAPSIQQASGSGTQRLYSFGDVVQLRVVKRLLDTGVSLQRIRHALDALHGRGHELAAATVVSDGQQVYLVDDHNDIVDLLAGGQGVFAIALGPVIDDLQTDLASIPTEPAGPESRASPRRVA